MAIAVCRAHDTYEEEVDMPESLLIIIDRKEFEERIAAMYWEAPRAEQIKFLMKTSPMQIRSERWVTNASPADVRQAISTAVATMPDLALGALAQQLLMPAPAERRAVGE
jgi:hypothetical protein